MIIHLYTICWNEEKMLPHFLKHYSEVCDRIFIYDNFSSDGSAAVCNAYPKVTLLQYDSGEQIREDIYLAIKNQIWKKSRGIADFVIVCDVDEFLYSPNLPADLLKLKETGCTLVRPVGYNMISSFYPQVDQNIFHVIRNGVRSSSFDKVILFDPNQIDEINYAPGAHTCFPIGRIQYADFELKLLHFKYLSLDYHLIRYQLMASRLSEYNKKNRFSFHYSFSKRKIIKEFKQIWDSRKEVI